MGNRSLTCPGTLSKKIMAINCINLRSVERSSADRVHHMSYEWKNYLACIGTYPISAFTFTAY